MQKGLQDRTVGRRFNLPPFDAQMKYLSFFHAWHHWQIPEGLLDHSPRKKLSVNRDFA
jgi:hypothetical protein